MHVSKQARVAPPSIIVEEVEDDKFDQKTNVVARGDVVAKLPSIIVEEDDDDSDQKTNVVARGAVVATLPSSIIVEEKDETDEPNDEAVRSDVPLVPEPSSSNVKKEEDDVVYLPPSYVAWQERLRLAKLEADLEAASKENSRVVDEVVRSEVPLVTEPSSIIVEEEEEVYLPPSYVAWQERLRLAKLEAELEAASKESSRVVDEVVLPTVPEETAESSLSKAFATSSLTPTLEVENMSEERRRLHERKQVSLHYAQKLAAHNKQLHQDQGFLAVLSVQTAGRDYL